jgi:hypothetical protein
VGAVDGIREALEWAGLEYDYGGHTLNRLFYLSLCFEQAQEKEDHMHHTFK